MENMKAYEYLNDPTPESEDELKEAKKIANVKSEKDMIKSVMEHAVETTDEKLFDNTLAFEEKSSVDEKVFDASINAMIIDKIDDIFPNLTNKEIIEKRTNRLRVLFDKISGGDKSVAENEESAVEILEQAVKILSEEVKKEEGPKKYEGGHIVKKGGIVETNIEKDKKNILEQM